ncbi:MAG: potassium channel family protein [Acidobacteria bacterium]|nr:potassium channel family protein [Acidobacteriota bacterium]
MSHAGGPPPERPLLDAERRELLARLEDWLETPMLVLGFVWLALLILEFTRGLSPALEVVGTIIWIVFILDFLLKFTLAPDKSDYLKANWLTALALAVPALRVFRIFRVVRVLRAARAARGLRLFRVVSSLNRGMRALGATMRRRGAGYVVALTVIVALAGAAGMYAFENEKSDGRGFESYGEALWWTAMVMTTMGSDYFPETTEGRVLCFALALYAFAVFGYVTATLATFFVGRDAESAEAELAGVAQVESLRAEVAALREELRAFARREVGGSEDAGGERAGE